jgi:hypothetical protein
LTRKLLKKGHIDNESGLRRFISIKHFKKFRRVPPKIMKLMLFIQIFPLNQSHQQFLTQIFKLNPNID